VGLEPEELHRERHHRGQERSTRHVLVLGEVRGEPVRDALRRGHSAEPGRVLHHSLALGDRELAEQEEALAGRGRDPVGIATARVEKRRLRSARGLLCQLDELVLDLERTQGLELSKGHDVAHYRRLRMLVVSDCIFGAVGGASRWRADAAGVARDRERVAAEDTPEPRLTVELLPSGPAVIRRAPRPKQQNARAGEVGSSLLARVIHHDSSMMRTMPQIVSSVLPTAYVTV